MIPELATLQGRRILIAGFGYAGRRMGELLAQQGAEVVGVVRSAASLENPTPVSVEFGDITDLSSCERLASRLGSPDVVVHCASSNRGGTEEAYRAVYWQGCRNLLAAFPRSRLFFTSSTSVYAQKDGEWVDESSAAEPLRGTGVVLRESETVVLDAGGSVLRLAGIYGPGRSVLLRNFLTGQSVIDVRQKPPLTPDGRWINQIHCEDIAGAVAHLLSQPEISVRGRIFNVSDSRPLTQRELFAALAARFSLPSPPESAPDESRKRGWTNKRVSNSLLLGLGWKPVFPSYFAALSDDPHLIPSILKEIAERR